MKKIQAPGPKDQPPGQKEVVDALTRQRAIGRELRRMFQDVVEEGVPNEFLDILQETDETGQKESGSQQQKKS